MKLNSLNNENPTGLSIDGYIASKGRGNINRKQAVDNPNKSEPNDSIPSQTNRSGNQYAAATNDQDKLEFLGSAEDGKDEDKSANLSDGMISSF